MYDSLVFYNAYGAGDLFESREFVKEIMNIIPAGEYYYCHQKHPRMFADIPNLKHNPVDSRMHNGKPYTIHDNRLFINTWVGHNGKYVLPYAGCVIEKNYQMFNDTLRKLKFPELSKPFMEYLPTVDYKYLPDEHRYNVYKFIYETQGMTRILVCNGIVNSNQAENFDFTIPIRTIASEHTEKLFLITDDKDMDWFKSYNVIPTQSIIKSKDGFDLNEITLLANFCNVIIGRKSGPFVFAHPREVWMDGDKKSLSFTYAKHSSHFVEQDDLPLRKYWSGKTDAKGVIEEIERILE